MKKFTSFIAFILTLSFLIGTSCVQTEKGQAGATVPKSNKEQPADGKTQDRKNVSSASSKTEKRCFRRIVKSDSIFLPIANEDGKESGIKTKIRDHTVILEITGNQVSGSHSWFNYDEYIYNGIITGSVEQNGEMKIEIAPDVEWGFDIAAPYYYIIANGKLYEISLNSFPSGGLKNAHKEPWDLWFFTPEVKCEDILQNDWEEEYEKNNSWNGDDIETYCFGDIENPDDFYRYDIKIRGDRVRGTYKFSIAEKDYNTGEFTGTIKDGILDLTVLSEGEGQTYLSRDLYKLTEEGLNGMASIQNHDKDENGKTIIRWTGKEQTIPRCN